jgi:hypothetical protein
MAPTLQKGKALNNLFLGNLCYVDMLDLRGFRSVKNVVIIKELISEDIRRIR